MEKSFPDDSFAKPAMNSLDLDKRKEGQQDDLVLGVKRYNAMNTTAGMEKKSLEGGGGAEMRLTRQDRYKFLRSTLRYEFMTPDEQVEGREVTPRDILLAFDDVTSTHGIPHIKFARGPIKKTFWIIATIGAVIGLGYNLFLITQTFVSHPVSVGIAIQHANDIEFPAITICNMSPVKKSAANLLNTAQAKKRRRKRGTADDSGQCCCSCCVVSSGTSPSDVCGKCGTGSSSDSNTCGKPTSPIITTASRTEPPSTSAPLTKPPTTGPPDTEPTTQDPYNPPPRQDFIDEETLTENLAALPADQRRMIGFTMNDMILDCQYAGSTCDPAWFVLYQNPIHGNCYIFNSGWNLSNSLVSHRTGRRFGLSMIVNINQADYVKDAGDTAGIRVVIHKGDRIPFPEDEGLTVSPGHSTSIGLQKVLISRLGSPFSDCIDTSNDKHDFSRNAYEQLYDDTLYSAAACSKTCYQRNVIAKCQCGDPSYPLEGDAFGGIVAKPCSILNSTEDSCRSTVLDQYNNNQLDCNCPTLCSDTSYSTSVSIGQWPSNIQLEPTLKAVAPKVTFDVYDNVTYKDNLIKMEIYFEEFNFQEISESPGYVLESYFSDVGGVLGLYLGMSFMSCLEFIELATDLVIFYSIKWIFILRYWKQLQKISPSLGPSGARTGPYPGSLGETGLGLTPETLEASMVSPSLAPPPQPPGYPGEMSLYDAYDTPIPFEASVALRRARRGRMRPDNIREVLLNL